MLWKSDPAMEALAPGHLTNKTQPKREQEREIKCVSFGIACHRMPLLHSSLLVLIKPLKKKGKTCCLYNLTVYMIG